ncbi:MAG: FAD-dependent oxidoreductase, partial [Salinisphaera sp.]|nr:FAD-dependent oxidoreductase [Salinisphaera sp.]
GVFGAVLTAPQQPGRRVAIVGGGFIGLEAAAVTSKLGLQVTVLEGLPRVLSRVTSPEVSSFYEAAHREAGVDLRTGVAVTAFERGKNGIEVVLGDEDRVEADFVIIGIGLIPHTELAAEAGLTVGNGIVVDEFTRTSDPDIFAVGDCSNHPNALTGGNIRLESVQNAMEQGRAAAHNLSGEAAPYQTVPWFWSDQYDLKLQMAGLSAGHDDHVLRGDPAARSFSGFYLREGRLIASDSINRPKDFMMAKRLVAADCRPTREQLEDENRNLKSLLPAS